MDVVADKRAWDDRHGRSQPEPGVEVPIRQVRQFLVESSDCCGQLPGGEDARPAAGDDVLAEKHAADLRVLGGLSPPGEPALPVNVNRARAGPLPRWVRRDDVELRAELAG